LFAVVVKIKENEEGKYESQFLRIEKNGLKTIWRHNQVF
jgi:hypothetical protein